VSRSLLRRALALAALGAFAAPGVLRAQSGPQDQPFLFTPAPLSAQAGASLLTSLDAGYAERSFSAVAPERLELRFGLQTRLGSRLALLSRVGMVPGGVDAGAMVEGQLMLDLVSARTGALALGFGGEREYGGTGVALARVAGALRGSRWQLAGNVRVEHPFAAGRDAADLLTSVGYERRLTPALALGVEGVAEDLEGLVETDEAEGGAKLMLGPTLALGSDGSHWLVLLGGGPIMYVNRNPRVSAAERALDDSGFVLRASIRHR
jgi:hypothetical protein